MADHAWCRDIARDAAVRAAEDGRARPLPTLAEAIARPFAEAAERSPTVSKTGEGQSGMRTERVVLEFEIERGSPPSEWPWSYILSRSDALKMRPGESVRVVEETHFDDLAQVAMERDAAIREREKAVAFWQGELRERTAERDAARARVAVMEEARKRFDTALEEARDASGINDLIVQRDEAFAERDAAIREREVALARVAHLTDANRALQDAADAACDLLDESKARVAELEAASGGGEGEAVADAKPFAWAVIEKGDDAAWCFAFRRDKDQAQREFPPSQFFQVPLYAAPPQPRGWLTGDERDAVERARRDAEFDAGLCADEKNAALGARDATVLAALLARSTPPEVVCK